jgi:hypothetical protein
MATTYTYQLASKYKTETTILGTVFKPQPTKYTFTTANAATVTKQYANAFASGQLVFTDGTSLSELQTNPAVAADAADDAKTQGITVATTVIPIPKLLLSAAIKSPLSIGPWVFFPGVVVQNASIVMNDPGILSAIARGLITFADGTNVVTFLQDPIVAAHVVSAHSVLGWHGLNNVYGA